MTIRMVEKAPPVLSVSGLVFSYPDRSDVLRGINLEVAAGERVGLIGPNGSGKTTFFLVVSGVLKPASGTVSLLGQPVTNGRFNHQVALVFQNPDNQLFCPSVSDDVAFGPQNMGLPTEEIRVRVKEALAVVNSEELSNRPVHHLSEGEKRMVTIAGVLAMRPKLVMYDEPSASLDIRSRRRLIRLLQSAQETFMIASHDLELVLEVCNRVILIDDGSIITDGSPREIMGDSILMESHGQEKPHSLTPHH